ncbi:MAG: efflux RND transporter permease subunit [Bacteroidota bacterium]
MRSIVTFFLKNPVASNLLMVLLLIFGYFGLMSMKSTFFPVAESRLISVRIVYPGASPEEVERGVILKIEDNLKGLTGVERVSSVSSENSGVVSIEVLQNFDTDLVLRDVKNAIDRIPSFPVGMEPPIIYKQENLTFSISFAISGDHDLATLKFYAREAENDLRAIDGISKISLTGFPDEEIEISFRESDLRAYNLTFNEAANSVRQSNLEITGGTIKGEKEELLVRVDDKGYYAADLRQIPLVTTPDGSIIRLEDVADVKDIWSDNPNRSFINGKPAVIVNVQNTIEEDLLDIADKVKAYMKTFESKYDGVETVLVRDGSKTLQQRIDLLSENGYIGFLLVFIFLGMFLHYRLAFWVAIAIPISFAGMFIFAPMLGVTINVISLFGMIIVIGILVDDGIVIGENIYQHYERGATPFDAAVEGTLEVFPAVTSAIITTAIAFSTFFFIDGRLGDFFFEMSIVVILTLVFSLVEGLLILPEHISHSQALNKDAKPGPIDRFFLTINKGFDWVMGLMRDKTYAPVLRFFMEYRFLGLAIPFGLMMISFAAVGGGMVKATFFPYIERDDFSVNIKLPSGTREQFTADWLDHIEKATWEVNDELSKNLEDGLQLIQKVEKNVGPTTYQGNMTISLLDGELRGEMSSIEIANAVRKAAGPIVGAESVTYGTSSPFGKPISVSIVGNEYDALKGAVEMLKAEMQEITELKDVVDNNQEGLREINIDLKEKALLLGLSVQDVLSQVRSGFFGSEVQRLQRGEDEVRVWVRYDKEDRSNIGKLENMRIRTPGGGEFPLSELANFSVQRGVIAINHIDGKREIKVEADVADPNASVSDLTANIQGVIVPAVRQEYPSVGFIFEGQNREQEKSAKSMQRVLPIIFILMFAVIALTFRSISQTIMVFALIPFCMIGVIWGHYIMALPISLFSILGVIALIGILVNDSLVFITTYNNMIKRGEDQMEAVFQAGYARFRPILLTSVTTVLGLGPLMLNKSFQAQFLIPMAASVAFGLLAATVILLIVLPIFIILANRYKVYTLFLWEGEKPAYEEVEPAYPDRKSGFGVYFGTFIVVVAAILLISNIF